MEVGEDRPMRNKENDEEAAQPNGATMAENMATSAAGSGNEGSEVDTDAFDEAAILKTLTSNVRDQDDLEREISHQGNLALIARDDKGDEKRIERAQASIRKLEAQKKSQQDRLAKTIGKPDVKTKIREEIARLDQEIQICQSDIADCSARIQERHQNKDANPESQSTKRKLPGESQQAFLVRTGKITPLAKVSNRRTELVDGELANVLVEAEEEAAADEAEKKDQQNSLGPRSHKYLPAPGISSVSEEPEEPSVPTPPRASSRAVESEFSLRPRKKRKLAGARDSSDEPSPRRSRPKPAAPEDEFLDDAVDDDESDDYDMTERPRKVPQKKSKGSKGGDEKVDLSQIDDGNEQSYQTRLAEWIEARRRERRRVRLAQGADTGAEDDEADQDDDKAEWLKPHPRVPDQVLENDLALPGDIHQALYDYQKTGIQWLSELYARGTGGILGDEMGLGKTIQMVSFVAALHHSGQLDRPVIVVAPATLLRQWVNEFHRWWPSLRVSILHASGSGLLNVRNEDAMEDEELDWRERSSVKRSSKAARNIVDRVVNQGHVLVTTYAGVQTYGDILIPVEWGYAVLDEGHKIRNPHAAITVYCKELRTSNRVILSGTPMQNNLTELWSLFDFVFPMRLGNLADFRRNIELPIRMGGYANASNLEVMTAERCAGILKDTISPYLLQRMKADVAADLPKKTELVLFCDLTREQREAYQRFLDSGEINAIMSKKLQPLAGIDILRKICNHPDLVDPKLKSRVSEDWGSVHKSGKMAVLKGALQLWKRQGHKTLLFSQGVLMLDILEKFIQNLGNFKYLRMDGSTAVKHRQALVDEFNGDPELDVFLLTTKVGGLGVNLTGANRVVIFDPDWNPSTDVQARERAWRLGQKKDVTIYRLMLRGTIEEKIYHRQIFKQFLSNKVLKDPKQRTALDLHNLHDLFTLGDAEEETETGRLFKDSKVQMDQKNETSKNSEQPALTAGTHTDDPQDLLGINGVAKLEDYQTDPASEPPPTEEARIMQGIFARAGVHSAHQHDEIMGGASGQTTRDSLHKREVDRVAAAATASLRRAHEEARRTPAGTVTDTGEFTTAASAAPAAAPVRHRHLEIPPLPSSSSPSAPSSRPRGGRGGRGAAGPSSGAILANLANRQGLNNTTSSSSPATTSGRSTPAAAAAGPESTDSLAAQFSRDLIAFIRAHGGRVPTKAIKDHFDAKCRTSRRVEVFKEVLNRVAKMDKTGSTMRGIWTLRE
ncbi:P-loop containing nucleoside triphosphate hydrolase [Apiospora marii]|uniref:P-loop containing nucleoside triphosphate hydrolase n=1 Tax=Apiospora marii TaxID=335849 RepID=A0ABR1RQT0_9PEZI